MAELRNEFRWSVSRQRTFDLCHRLYYYRHYGFWNGWLPDAAAEARLCYRFSKMTNLPMLAGSVVHKLIERTVKRVAQGHPPRSLEALQEWGRNELNLAWQQSRRKRWMVDPKRNANLFEHYYGREVTDEYIAEIRTRALDSLANFHRSDVLATIRHLEPSAFLSIEDLLTFDLDGVPVSLRMDLAIEVESTLQIYDWKSGGVDESYTHQLVTYALYAEQVWGYTLDRIQLFLFYLANDHLQQPYRVSPDERTATIAAIRHNCEQMLSLLVDRENNVARKEDFARTGDESRCEWCFFRELCYG